MDRLCDYGYKLENLRDLVLLSKIVESKPEEFHLSFLCGRNCFIWHFLNNKLNRYELDSNWIEHNFSKQMYQKWKIFYFFFNFLLSCLIKKLYRFRIESCQSIKAKIFLLFQKQKQNKKKSTKTRHPHFLPVRRKNIYIAPGNWPIKLENIFMWYFSYEKHLIS